MAIATAVVAFHASRTAHAQAFQAPPHFQVVSLPGTYNLPVGLTFAADGTALLIEKPGRVRVIHPAGDAQAAPFVDLTAEVNNDHDRGMLGVALHPGFIADGGPHSWVYLLYTVSPVYGQDYGFGQDQRYSFSRLVRYRAVTLANDIIADEVSRQVLLGHQLADGTVPDGIASVHNSHSNGSLRFADDGSLILTTGDGAHYDGRDTGGRDNPAFDTFVHPVTGLHGPTPKAQDEGALRSQDLHSLSGKVLRIDPETGFGYASNPFFDGDPTSLPSRVWALGLRNPYRMNLVAGTGSSDPSLGHPNVITIGDVGWNRWEEIDVSRTGGENFGWPCFEGPLPQSSYQGFVPPDPSVRSCATSPVGNLTLPVIAWNHGAADSYYPPGTYLDGAGNPLAGFRGNCSIGGAVYTGGTYPAEYQGRLFFGDYGTNTLKTLEFDANFGVVAVRDFASQTGGIVDIECHPLTGDLYCLSLATNRVLHVSYGANSAPLAPASVTPIEGAGPLLVSFDGSEAMDPDGDYFTYDWDFGDSTAHSAKMSPAHIYRIDGAYAARLTVTDTYGASASTDLAISVGNLAPKAFIQSPTNGTIYSPPTTLTLAGIGTDAEDGLLTYTWDITLYHAVHVHPGTFQATGPVVTFDIGTSVEDAELLYYRIELTVTDPAGLSDHAHVFVYPQSNRRDVSGTAIPIARVFELTPPHPTGAGNPDIEVIRDSRFPTEGSVSAHKQFDTQHGGDQGSDDWLGYALAAPPTVESRFVGLTFQEGRRTIAGGWFEDLSVEVRDQGTWTPVAGLRATPQYPLGAAFAPFFSDFNYHTYQLDFDPQFGDAIRLRGTPAGNVGFLSCAELRVQQIAALIPSSFVDWTERAHVIGDASTIPGPAARAPTFDTRLALRDGTRPPVGSPSELAQFRTRPNAVPWIGYSFDVPHRVSRIEYQEGLDTPIGGAFSALTVEVQATAGGAWQRVSGLSIAPPYPGPNGTSYESFTLDFTPVVARAIRLRGPAAGTDRTVTVGELRVLGPTPP